MLSAAVPEQSADKRVWDAYPAIAIFIDGLSASGHFLGPVSGAGKWLQIPLS
jgi:hypothetical protein